VPPIKHAPPAEAGVDLAASGSHPGPVEAASCRPKPDPRHPPPKVTGYAANRWLLAALQGPPSDSPPSRESATGTCLITVLALGQRFTSADASTRPRDGGVGRGGSRPL